jgi:hypothetical protein
MRRHAPLIRDPLLDHLTLSWCANMQTLLEALRMCDHCREEWSRTESLNLRLLAEKNWTEERLFETWTTMSPSYQPPSAKRIVVFEYYSCSNDLWIMGSGASGCSFVSTTLCTWTCTLWSSLPLGASEADHFGNRICPIMTSCRP